MTIKTAKQSKVTLSIVPGPVSPLAQASWKKFWTARIAEVQAELKVESEGKDEL